MIVTADWVLPVASEPLAGGAVLVEGGRIAMVGTLEGVTAAAPDEPVERFDGCVIMPGLVNAHTHLSLTVLGGLVEPMPMRQFLARVTSAVVAMSEADFAASAALGALECLRNGVTCVGDIAYGPVSLAACAAAGVAGVFYFEVLGAKEADVPSRLEAEGYVSARDSVSRRLRRGVSPHAPYSSGPGTLRATHAIARRDGAGYAIHLAESPAERELMISGTGARADAAARLAEGFTAPGVGPVAYLERLGVLDGALAVHCVVLEPGDARLLAASTVGVALCPRSNAFLGNGGPPVADLRDAGVRLCLGTDSPASNWDLDLFEEARALQALDPDLTPTRLIEIVTRDGARALGLDGTLGSLAKGLDADLTVLRLPSDARPEAAVIALGGRNRVAAVMTEGDWRIRDGASTAATAAIEAEAAHARAVAKTAIGPIGTGA